MEAIKSFFFDTYALFEIVHENKNYKPYTNNVTVITTKLNLMELHYILLRHYGLEYAEKAFEHFRKFCVEFDDVSLKECSQFKFDNYRRDLSYVDCLGYVIAKKFNAKFLSGDEQFKDFDNVEFVK